MGKQHSSGILLYCLRNGKLEIFLVHPGGPYWNKKDNLAWSIPKGELDEGEEPLNTAKREFHEETGSEVNGIFQEMTPLKQPSGKIVYAWALEGDIDPISVRSNTFAMEWPPGSGVKQEFPEIDKGEWFGIQASYKKILPGQRGFLDQLQDLLGMKREVPS